MESFPALSWIINNECNLKCIHCYTGSSQKREQFSPLNDEDFALIKNNLADTKFNFIFLSGGEPACDKNIFKFLDLCRSLKPNNLFMLSNGLLLDDEHLLKFKNAGVTGFSIGYQHYDSNVADRLYGQSGVHKRIFENVKKIKDMGFLLYFDTIIMRENYLHLEEMIKFAIENEIDNITFKRYASIGRGENPYNLILSKEENRQAIQALLRLKEKYRNLSIVIHDPLASIEIYNKLEQEGYTHSQIRRIMGKDRGCFAGTSWIGVDSFGNVIPCPLMLHTGPVLGNLTQKSFQEILSTSEYIQDIQKSKSDKYLQSCKYSFACGGCKCHIATETGKIYGSDPMCCVVGKCPIQMV